VFTEGSEACEIGKGDENRISSAETKYRIMRRNREQWKTEKESVSCKGREEENIETTNWLVCNRNMSQDRLSSIIINASLPNPSSRSKALAFTQPLTEISTRRHFWLQSAAGA
jgi:cAMP phosphodiesterase